MPNAHIEAIQALADRIQGTIRTDVVCTLADHAVSLVGSHRARIRKMGCDVIDRGIMRPRAQKPRTHKGLPMAKSSRPARVPNIDASLVSPSAERFPTVDTLPESLKGTRLAIVEMWPDILERARARGARRTIGIRLPKPGSLELLSSSLKIEKGLKYRVDTRVLYLSPADASGVDICPFRSPECTRACLANHSGQMRLPDSHNARMWRTILMLGDRRLFFHLLALETESHIRSAKRNGYVPAFRLDGTSDLGFGDRMSRRYPEAQWYDYTKNPNRVHRWLRERSSGSYRNYHLTFSYSGHNLDDALGILCAGGNVAVVFDADARNHGPIPSTWYGFPVIDGDDSDVRFYDPAGSVVGLRFKAGKKRDDVMRDAGVFVCSSLADPLELCQ